MIAKCDRPLAQALTRHAHLLLLVVACGAPPAPDTPAAPKLGAPQPAPATAATAVLHYARLDRAFLEKHLPTTTDAECLEFANRPAEARYTLSDTRHILFKLPKDAPPDVDAAARRKAEAALQRLTAKEDIGALARELSEDPGSKANGGLYSWDRIGHFVAPYREAYFKTPPGEAYPEPVKSKFGWHVIWKEPADDAAKIRGCRRYLRLTAHYRLAIEANRVAQETPDENIVLNRTLARELGSAASKEAPPFERLDPSGPSKEPPCAELRKKAEAPQNLPDSVRPGAYDLDGDFFLTKVYLTKDAPNVPVGNACKR